MRYLNNISLTWTNEARQDLGLLRYESVALIKGKKYMVIQCFIQENIFLNKC